MAAPTYIQSSTGGSFGGGNLSVHQVYTGVQAAGNCNIICFSINAANPISVTDTSGNTYNYVASQVGSGNWTSFIYIAFGISAAAAGGNTVTVTFSAATTLVEFIILEYANAVAVIGSAGVTGNNNTPTSPNISPVSANELLFSYTFASASTTMSAGSGYTLRATAGFWDGTEDALSVSSSPVHATFGSTNSVAWVCFIVDISSVASPACTPVGGHYDFPIVATMSCATPGASIYYTIDGSIPTVASTLYTGQIVIPAGSITLSMVAILSGASSRVVVRQFYIQSGGLWNTIDDQFDVTTGLRIYQFECSIMYDPVSGYWYKYGDYYDTMPVGDLYIYKSADLLNWQFVAHYPYIAIRPCVLYNALNNNYVMWGNYIGANSSKASFVSSSPDGPFVQVNLYDTWQSINIDIGDSSAFLDPNTGFGYLLTECNGNTDLMVVRLSSDFKSLTNTYALTTSSAGEAATMWTNGPGSYFLMQSGQSNYAPNTCTYQWSSSPLGPWAAYSSAGNNPFQAATIPQTAGEIAAGLTATPSNSYDTQTCQVLIIPGRNAFIYCGDRYDSGTNPLPNYRRILLPIVQGSTSFTISWTPTWNLNTTFPTVSGAPLPVSNLTVIGNIVAWSNNELKACNLYLDIADDFAFTQNVLSQVITAGSASFVTSKVGNFYRIRTVNANGVSLSPVQTRAAPRTSQLLQLPHFAPWQPAFIAMQQEAYNIGTELQQHL